MNVAAASEDSDIPENIRQLWLEAVAAYELQNFGYAISLLKAILDHHHDFEDAKDLLFKCEDFLNQK